MDGEKVTRLHPISRSRKDLEPGSVSGTLGSLARARGYCGKHSAGGWHSEHMPLIEALCCPSGISAHLGSCMPTANQNITIMLLDLVPAVPSKFRQIQYIYIYTYILVNYLELSEKVHTWYCILRVYNPFHPVVTKLIFAFSISIIWMIHGCDTQTAGTVNASSSKSKNG